MIVITGATGLVGGGIARRLLQNGQNIRLLVRNPDRLPADLRSGPEIVVGDITDADAVSRALTGATVVYHAAGMPEQWARNDSVFDAVNRGGTRNVVRAAMAQRVQRLVYTSTMDVFAAPPGGTLVETNPDPHPKPTAYERSKMDAQTEVDTGAHDGLDAVHVNPGSIYGQGPADVAMNGLLLRIAKRKVPALPKAFAPIVHIDGVVDAHLAAAERGKSNERYLVGDAYVSYRDFAQAVANEVGLRSLPPVAPLWLLGAVATVSAPFAKLFGFRPPVARGEVAFLRWSPRVDATKAQKELGFKPISLEEGVARTVRDFRKAGLL